MNKTAAIVLNYVNYTDTIKCVQNIIEKKAPIDIIIVDNNSPNHSVSVLKEKFSCVPNCYIIAHDKNKGYAAGNNIGIRYAAEHLPHIEFICIMNPDTLFDDAKIFPAMENVLNLNEQYAVAAPVMKLNQKDNFSMSCWRIPSGFVLALRQLSLYKAHLEYKYPENNESVLEVDAVSGSLFMIKLNVLKQIGYLDEGTFMYCEETLLGIELKKLGYKEVELLHERFYHNHDYSKSSKRITLPERLQKKYHTILKSRIYVCKKYYAWYWLLLLYFTTFIELIYTCFLHAGYLCKRLLKHMKK